MKPRSRARVVGRVLVIKSTDLAVWLVLVTPFSLRAASSLVSLWAFDHGRVDQNFSLAWLLRTVLERESTLRKRDSGARPGILSVLTPSVQPEREPLRKQVIAAYRDLVLTGLLFWLIALAVGTMVTFAPPMLFVVQATYCAVLAAYGYITLLRRRREPPTAIAQMMILGGAVGLFVTLH
jgi:hypothetical protein